ncbi:DUF1929 domain-containing protein (plasmid) [Embleya sp. NBC_00888]|uniref:galactose oxidase-like domain-containing protein n=1 Tax=Embleya sp. NBC_00888 TaxID=2975960 RepID=UPI002F91312B|nr:DUF1929 domain-containing protein [Embleya sp. NBC_00888]
MAQQAPAPGGSRGRRAGHPETDESSQVAALGDPDYLAPAIASSIDTTSVLLPLRPSKNYEPSVLLCGGTTPRRIDLADDSPAWRTTGTRPPNLNGPRYNLNAVLLPSGEVFVSGGVANKENDDTAVRTAEKYHPDSNTWDRLQDATVRRNYHSVALLMPDGAVWTAGSNMNGKPGTATRELRIETYKPWYFDRQRPQLISAPEHMAYAQQPEDAITVEVAHADTTKEVAVIHTSSTTHAFSSDQRYVELSFSVVDARHLRVIPPPTGGIAPPGMYLIFILDSARVPSHGRFITIAPPDKAMLDRQISFAEARHNLIARLIADGRVEEAVALVAETIAGYRRYARLAGADVMRVGRDLASLADQMTGAHRTLEATAAQQAADDIHHDNE